MAAFDIGIDLGTTKIIIYRSDSGIALNEPSIVAYNTKDNSVIAVGKEAYNMLGKTPRHIITERPLRDGVISSHKLCEVMIKEYIKRVCGNFFIKPRIVLCIPSITTDVERRAVVEAALAAGARKVYMIEEPIAAAIGAGIDILKPEGHMVVDIGGGTTDVAVISLSSIVCSKSIKTAGNAIDEEIVKFLMNQYKLSIGQRMAENIKKEIGCVYHPDANHTTMVKGRNLLTSYPQQIEISEETLYECILGCAEKIIDTIKLVLERTPPELIGDIYNNGIILTGGGALINGLAELISEAVKIPVKVAENPVEVVSIGTGKAFKYLAHFHDGFIDADIYRH